MDKKSPIPWGVVWFLLFWVAVIFYLNADRKADQRAAAGNAMWNSLSKKEQKKMREEWGFDQWLKSGERD